MGNGIHLYDTTERASQRLTPVQTVPKTNTRYKWGDPLYHKSGDTPLDPTTLITFELGPAQPDLKWNVKGHPSSKMSRVLPTETLEECEMHNIVQLTSLLCMMYVCMYRVYIPYACVYIYMYMLRLLDRLFMRCMGDNADSPGKSAEAYPSGRLVPALPFLDAGVGFSPVFCVGTPHVSW